MYPCIKPGQQLLVSPVESHSIRRYQVIVFTSPRDSSTWIAHRVLRVTYPDGDEPVFLTRGDNPRSSFVIVRASQVQGRVVGKIGNGRAIYSGRMTELPAYIRSYWYWLFKIHFKWLVRIGLNCSYPFLRKKYVLLERQGKVFIIKATIFRKTLGACRIKSGVAEYYCSNHLMAYWKKSLQSKLKIMTSKLEPVCKNAAL